MHGVGHFVQARNDRGAVVAVTGDEVDKTAQPCGERIRRGPQDASQGAPGLRHLTAAALVGPGAMVLVREPLGHVATRQPARSSPHEPATGFCRRPRCHRRGRRWFRPRPARWAAHQAYLEHRRLEIVAAGDAGGSLADDAVDVARLLHPEVKVSGSAVSGDPRQVLIDASTHAYMLVLGSRGRGAVKSMLLGSVSATVSAHAVCPVVVCRPAADGKRQSGVVVGADATPSLCR